MSSGGFVVLPEEIVRKILLKLPVKSLITLKSVSKSLRTLINDPSFATQHLNKAVSSSSSSTTLYLLWHRLVDDEHVHSLVTLSDSSDSDSDNGGDQVPCALEDLDLSIIPGQNEVDRWRGHHCIGVVWLQGKSLNSSATKNFLYNPALRESKLLPRHCDDYLVRGEGFGFDYKANTHKFVRIVTTSSASTREPFVEIYTIGSDSWREIKIDFNFPCIDIIQPMGVHCRGVCYWTASTGERPIVVAFDLSSEQFRGIAIPDELLRGGEGLRDLAVWNECLCLPLCFGKEGSEGVEMWSQMWALMEDGGWTEGVTVGPLVGVGLPVAFWKSDEFLARSDGRVVSYNVGTKKIRYLPFVAPGTAFHWGIITGFYVESLVSVKDRN